MTRPQLVSATTAQLDELVGLAKTRTAFSAEQYWLLEQVLDTFAHVLPAGLSATKYDHSCASMLAVQR